MLAPQFFDLQPGINNFYNAREAKRRQEAQDYSIGQDQADRSRDQQALEAISGYLTGGQPVGASDGSYMDNVRMSESGGDNMARNENSSATGPFQFINSTWQGLALKYPHLGLTPDGRTDPEQSKRAMMAFTADNKASLERSGIEPSDGLHTSLCHGFRHDCTGFTVKHTEHMRHALEDERQRDEVGFFHHRTNGAEVEVADFNRADANLLKSVRLRAQHTTMEHLHLDFAFGGRVNQFGEAVHRAMVRVAFVMDIPCTPFCR